MKRIVCDFTEVRRGTGVGTGQIEYCAKCGRKGVRSSRTATAGNIPVGVYITVLHTVSVRRVLGFDLATIDECVTTEPLPAPGVH